MTFQMPQTILLTSFVLWSGDLPLSKELRASLRKSTIHSPRLAVFNLGLRTATTDCLFPFPLFDQSGPWASSVGGIEEEGLVDVARENHSHVELGRAFVAEKRLAFEVVVRSLPDDHCGTMPWEVLAEEAT